MPATPESHSARYFALLYSSATERPALEALFGIEHEVFDSLRAGLDHQRCAFAAAVVAGGM